MNKLKQIWSKLRSSFWFVPSLIVAFSIALAVALVEASSTGIEQWLARWPRLFGAGAEGARGMLSTIAGISVLIFFIHHIASTIQASNIIASVVAETMVAVDRLFPEKLGNGPVDGNEDQSPLPPPFFFGLLPGRPCATCLSATVRGDGVHGRRDLYRTADGALANRSPQRFGLAQHRVKAPQRGGAPAR